MNDHSKQCIGFATQARDEFARQGWFLCGGHYESMKAGMLLGMYVAGGIDAIDYASFDNQIRFLGSRAKERYQEGLPV